MATHFRILAWRIPWTEEAGGLQTRGSQSVGADDTTLMAESRGTKEPLDEGKRGE